MAAVNKCIVALALACILIAVAHANCENIYLDSMK